MSRELQVLQDAEGFYIATDDGWDVCKTCRFGSFQDAQAELAKWNAEDEEDRGYQDGFKGKVAASQTEAYRKGYSAGHWDRFDTIIAAQEDVA